MNRELERPEEGSTNRAKDAEKVPAPPGQHRSAAALWRWYRRGARDLPWRRTADPYAIWVSEVMLQQTRVETVLAYYPRFLERYPTVEALAAARQDEVVALWSGLGYYARARRLHAAAQAAVEAGGLPLSAAEWRRLPGVGVYTAAAVASMAHGERVAVLDGNAVRVLARLSGEAGNPQRRPTQRRLLAVAESFLEPRRPGDSNQALMELGAKVCRPRRPRCRECPLQSDCVARQRGRPGAYPPRRHRRAVEERRAIAVIVVAGGRCLLVRRPRAERQLADSWELPWVEVDDAATAAVSLARRYGGRWQIGAPLGQVGHAITHRRWTITVHGGAVASGVVAEGRETGWFAEAQRRELPRSSWVDKAWGLWRARDRG